MKFVEDSLLKIWYVGSNFLKAAFRKFHLVHSWILCPMYIQISENGLCSKTHCCYSSYNTTYDSVTLFGS